MAIRSIQRDLNDLSCILPLVVDNARPQGWSWQTDADPFHLPFLDPVLPRGLRLQSPPIYPGAHATLYDALL